MAAVMIIGVTILVFFIMSLSPIDQAYSVLGENATARASPGIPRKSTV